MPAGRYRAIDRIHRMVRSPFRMKVSRSLGGWSFHCDLRDSIAREVCFTGRYEPQETALVRALLKPGMTFVDVGANWGYFTLLAAHQVGTSGKVISLEPDPRLFPIFADNIALNRLTHVTALEVAAGGERGTLTLAGFNERDGNFGLSRVVEREYSNKHQFQVAARTLDDILTDLRIARVDLLKMDIEGAEGFALRGMRYSLANRRVQRILLELHPAQLAEHGQSSAALIEKLQKSGFDVWRIDHSPRANRWASYRRNFDVKRLLHRLDIGAPLDRWPHVYLQLRGLKLAC
jgi:FkbM family methyltransferase